MKIHGNKQEAASHIIEMFNSVMEHDAFMVAFWAMDKTGKLQAHRTTWQFPTDRFEEALSRLREILFQVEDPPALPLPDVFPLDFSNFDARMGPCDGEGDN